VAIDTSGARSAATMSMTSVAVPSATAGTVAAPSAVGSPS